MRSMDGSLCRGTQGRGGQRRGVRHERGAGDGGMYWSRAGAREAEPRGGAGCARLRGGRAAPWRADDRLQLAARRHAEDMVERDYFSHDSPGGRDLVDRIRRTGWPSGRSGWRAGEVLAWGTREAGTPRSIVAAWMRSPGHRRVLMDEGFDVAGIGVARGAPRRPEANALTVALVAAE